LAARISAVQAELDDAKAEHAVTKERVKDETAQMNEEKADFAKLQEAYDAESTNVKALEAELRAAGQTAE
jgi:chromosome condensin MukBEF ATPase and DNA-binding subunit MukB